MTDHQFSLFGFVPTAFKQLDPLYLAEFNDRIYQSKDYSYISDFAKFWGVQPPIEFAPVHFRVDGVCLRRIRGIAQNEDFGYFL